MTSVSAMVGSLGDSSPSAAGAPGGRLITLEGTERCGKSTQAAILARKLDAVLTREPGGTALGERIRDLLLDPRSSPIGHRAEALLLAAARAQLVAEVVRPALESGRHVVSDRFSDSSLAYQGHGRGLPLQDLRLLSDWASAGLWPDVTVLVDVPEEVARDRRGTDVPDRFESEDRDFHRRVVEGYRQLAAAEPDRWRVVDGSGTVEAVAARVWDAISGVLA
jgi:dTMP kinase